MYNLYAIVARSKRKFIERNGQTYQECNRCKTLKPFTHAFFREVQSKTYTLDGRCRQCYNEIQGDKRSDFKRQYLQSYYDGGCECCGFNKCIEVLEFHHRDPSEKEFSPANIMHIKSGKREQELEKCDVLCSNCHRGFHSGHVVFDEWIGYYWKC